MSRRRLNVVALQAELHRAQGRLPTDCAVCREPLPKTWPHPEHARCRPQNPQPKEHP